MDTNSGYFRNIINNSNNNVNNNINVCKKMKKRKELDALVSNSVQNNKRLVSKRYFGNSSNNGLLCADSSDDEFSWSSNKDKNPKSLSSPLTNRYCSSYLKCKQNNMTSSKNNSLIKQLIGACSFIFVFTCILSTCSVLYLFLDIKQQTSYLNHQLDEVVAGSQGVPDLLQSCHSVTKQLEKNQTELLNKFNSISTLIKNFSIQISELHITISKVEEKLNASPQVIDVPARLSELSNNVALFGSTIKDLNNTVNKINEKSKAYDSTNNIIQTNITALKENIESVKTSITNTPVNHELDEQLKHTVEELKVNLTKINQTLEAKLKWIKEDQQKDHNSIESLQGSNENTSTRISSLQVDINKMTSSLLDDIHKINSSLLNATPTSSPSPSSIPNKVVVTPGDSPLGFNLSPHKESYPEQNQFLPSTDDSPLSNNVPP